MSPSSRSCIFKISSNLLVLALSAGLGACGYGSGSSYSSITGSMAGQWDFVFTNAKGKVPFVIEATLDQDHHGAISGKASVTANGPTGSVFDVLIGGGSLSNPFAIILDYLGFSCSTTDTGDRSITGTLNSSNQVTLNWNIGGSGGVTITGTLDNSLNPSFTGTYAPSGACAFAVGSITGNWRVLIIPGDYAGTSAADSTRTMSVNLNEDVFSGSLTGNGTDSKLGNFTLSGTAVGYGFSGTLTYPSSPASSGPMFGYYDRELNPPNGSIFLVSFVGTNTTTCPNGEPYYQGTCQIAILAHQ